MKIRNGFVSNSSSSSFIVLGKSFTSKELDNVFGETDDIYQVLEDNDIEFVADSEVDKYYIGNVIAESDDEYMPSEEVILNDIENYKGIKILREKLNYKGPLTIYTGTRAC
jgi:3-dehydroquinate synthetase